MEPLMWLHRSQASNCSVRWAGSGGIGADVFNNHHSTGSNAMNFAMNIAMSFA